MKIGSLVVIAASTTVLALPASSAKATMDYNNHGWWWSVGKMEAVIYNEGLPWVDQNHQIYTVDCKGVKPGWRSKGTLLYKKFNCAVDTNLIGGGDEWHQYRYYIYAYVLGKYQWVAVKRTVRW